MTRLATRAGATTLAGAALSFFCAVFLGFTVGCQDQSKPPIQTVSNPGAEEEEVRPPTADEKKVATEYLDRAIAAHGGPVRLQKLRRHIQLRKGKVQTAQFGAVDSDQELRLQLPDRVRLFVKGFTPQGPQEITVALDGAGAWMKDAAGSRELSTDEMRAVRDEFNYLRLITLLPLKDDEFVIRPLDGEPVGGRPTVGLRVGSKGRSPLNLYFDAKEGLLLKTAGRLRAGSVSQRHEVTFSEHKLIDGVMLPARLLDVRDGVQWLNVAIEYKLDAEFSAKDFERPAD